MPFDTVYNRTALPILAMIAMSASICAGDTMDAPVAGDGL